jgi:gluconate 2-dehydrogenase gamma chain
MMPDDVTRRRFLGVIAAGAGTLWWTTHWPDVVAAAEQARAVAASEQPPPLRVLTAEQAADLEAMAAQIIPTDDTPGAREARVVYFMDQELATRSKHRRPEFEKGLRDLRRRVARRHPRAASFAALGGEQQIAILRDMEKAKSEFFENVRAATIVGMLALPEYGGNYQKIGWKMIGFDDRFSWAAPFGHYDREGAGDA